ncbi:hypothetical protein PHYBLDRAFT_177969 [Phycomyces blakesleeanus NRRL 1555(-)]|uniref:B box-type domain-containing protein n=2 Tax=Phycomyces blakesleeanus TaxID=4837 RepID=A0A162PMA9_PHYB8|nr:hypothetical protein PHYBLDRAFT_177969 [Phycomyces blakesleeanus NRRL 1555(-)]OAD70276.1 hypothetical protein PHYBLDRAFT_177969 [Phycomyces blakesleeanus NRRL 1555(-)]|eukprot:XP_018288316.1 hypothetical protein PHYBLDRAFT_177969 [Phycomyces blakesleeanus NRRL 1555(-)]
METDDDENEFIDIDKEAPPGYCVECKDQRADVYCQQCNEPFCEVCNGMIHRTGKRAKHTSKSYKAYVESGQIQDKADTSMDAEPQTVKPEPTRADFNVGEFMEDRAKYIPVRLTMEERKFLRLLEAALNVTEYTDKIDDISHTSKAKRTVAQIKELCAVLTGLVLAGDYRRGQELFSDRSYDENQEFFQRIFEIGRRHKIMNPEKMRSAYGKLMYLLADSMIPEVQEMLGFTCVTPIKSVYSVLKECHCIEVLHEDIILVATHEIIPEGKTRPQIQMDIKRKERAIEQLSRKYQSKHISADDIRQCLYSIGDNQSYLRANRDPCERVILYLEKYFHPTKEDPRCSLSIAAGAEGHRLSHDHETQYIYVNQTLKLWREILNDMFKLWTFADQDMLSTSNPYRLIHTGQGLHRVQACPQVSREMHRTLYRAQKKAGTWIGSSVIHLGDKNVPNSLMFIDKYNQVARILSPICLALDKLDELKSNDGLKKYIDSKFGGVTECRKVILADFFRGAFDGSGADNFYDAGSCIDGRLTSAWNWCSQIEQKPYFPVFLLTGFVGFDGGGWS